MSFGQNLQFLRKMHKGMTQDDLAEKIGVSRQTISKWEMDSAFPEMEKALMLCDLFSCTLDGLLRENINSDNEAYSNIRIVTVPSFRYVRYAVISAEPETDAISRIRSWAVSRGVESPEIIGWNFPFVSQEQVNVFHMHGYTAACVLNEQYNPDCDKMEIITQPSCQYAAITIKEPFQPSFSLIPNAYKTLMRYMEGNNITHKQSKECLSCFEKEYIKDSVTYMDIFIAADI